MRQKAYIVIRPSNDILDHNSCGQMTSVKASKFHLFSWVAWVSFAVNPKKNLLEKRPSLSNILAVASFIGKNAYACNTHFLQGSQQSTLTLINELHKVFLRASDDVKMAKKEGK